MDSEQTIHVLAASSRDRASISRTIFALGYHCEVYADFPDLSSHSPRRGIIVARDEIEQGGIKLILQQLNRLGLWLPVIAAHEAPVPRLIVEAIKAGALDYLPLPLEPDRFARCLARVNEEAAIYSAAQRRMIQARNRISNLSNREREVLDLLSLGSSNKVIARELEISPRTVEIHRANMMNKLGAKHSAEAVRLKLEAKLDAGA